MIEISFVMERHLGHGTYADNLRSMVSRRTDVSADWIAVEYRLTDRWWERLPAAQVKSVLRGRREIAAGVRNDRADVRVFNTQVPAVIGGRRARGKPYVLCTDVTPRQFDAMAAGYSHRADREPLKTLKHTWNRHVIRRAAADAPWSGWARHSLIEDYDVQPDRIEVIPPGVDTASWVTACHAEGPLRILFVGGDFQRKGGDILLRAIDELPDARTEVRAVTRSDVPRRPGLTIFRLSANDPQLRELYRTSDVFVLPSRSETFGIAAVEGAAAGLPVVVSSVGGLRDLVIDGETGYAIEPGDVAGLVRVLRRLQGDAELRAALGRRGRARAVAEFDAAKNADRLVALAARAAMSTGSNAPLEAPRPI